jgi:Tol biopolymer transport system component
MGKKNALLAAGLLIVGLAVVPLASQTGNQWDKQLRAAIDKEVMDGDLKGAIEQYKKIIAARGASRAVVAKAMLQLGGCYEKQGSAEARKTFEQLLKNYPDQTEIVAQARTRLAALAPGAAGQAAGGGIRIQQIWTGQDVDTDASPSPDGRYLSYISIEGDLMVRDVTAGVDRQVAGLVKTDRDNDAISPHWSPDGKKIAYECFSRSKSSEIRIYEMSSNTSRVLFGIKPDRSEIYPGNWSRDGKLLLAFLSEQGGSSVGVISVESGEFRAIKTFEPRHGPGRCELSPDGKFIAYNSTVGQRENRDLFVLEVSTGKESCHLEHPATEFLLGWTPDGRYLLFQSNRTGNKDVWAQRIDNGRPASEPELVKSFGEWLSPMGFSTSGAFFYSTSTGGSDVYLTEIDLINGTATAPQKISKSHEGSNTNCEFSPDGRYLAYLTVRETISPRTPDNYPDWADTICVYSMETDRIREYPTEIRIQRNYAYRLRWSNDNQAIVFTALENDPNSPYSLHKLDTRNGEITKILGGKAVPFWSWTDNAAFMLSENPDRTAGLIRRDLQTGTDKKICNLARFPYYPTLSPDNQLVAFMLSEGFAQGKGKISLMTVSVADGAQKVILAEESTMSGYYNTSIGWTADSRNILLSRMSRDPSKRGLREIWQVPLDGGTPKKIDINVGSLRFVTAHPDGKRIAFVANTKREDTVWVMDNFLPPAKDAKQSK